MTEEHLVPFGKHRGKPVEALLADQDYLNWLMAQPWFRERFASLYTVVINYGQAPTETPEHNALQIKFLDPEYCLKFATVVHGAKIFDACYRARVAEVLATVRQTVRARYDKHLAVFEESRVRALGDYSPERLRERIAKLEAAHAAWLAGGPADDRSRQRYGGGPLYEFKPEPVPDYDKEWQKWTGYREEAEARYQAALAQARTVLEGAQLKMLTPHVVRVEALRFEQPADGNTRPIDVQFHVRCGFTLELTAAETWITNDRPTYRSAKEEHYVSGWAGDFAIEVKPSVGDDYPAVLRQMQGSDSKFLFLSAYTGRGVSEEQFVSFFGTQKITVVFEADVDTVHIPPCDREITLGAVAEQGSAATP